MYLENIPDEILIIIFKQLDYVSLSNVYQVSLRFRNLLVLYKIIKKFNLSCNTLATVHTLQSNYFKDVCHNLLELNMCGVHNLTKSALISAAHRLKSLKSLDISYTDIHLFDFMEIYSRCPTINKIKINFSFGKKQSVKVGNLALLKCQEMFQNFECVNFVGSIFNLMYSEIALFILSKACLKILQFTIIEHQGPTYANVEIKDLVQFDHLFVSILNDGSKNYGNIENIAFFNHFLFQNYEYIIISSLDFNKFTVYSSPAFAQFFLERFNIRTSSEANVAISGNVCIMLWKKYSIVIDDTFFEALFWKIKQYFPHYFEDTGNVLSPAHEWYLTNPRQQDLNSDNSHDFFEVSHKKRRIVSNFSLNYDNEFKEKQELELSLFFTGDIKSAVTLSTNSLFLNKLTYLNLCGSVRFSNEFFNILFRSCDKLITLNVETYSRISIVSSSISRSIPLSHTIKNFRLVDYEIDFNTLFTSLSQCSTLENINITNRANFGSSLFDPSAMIQKCANLFCVFIYDNLNQKICTKQSKIINEAKAKCNKTHINFKIYNILEYCYHPYIDVFKLRPIKPLQLFY